MSASSQSFVEITSRHGSISKKSLWAGRIISGLVAAFMTFDGVIHIMKPPPVVQGFAQLGFPIRLAIPLGIVSLTCAALYAIPRTSILGAILLTGYLGGAVAIQVPTGNSFFGEVVFPVYIGILVWGGLYLRDEGLRKLIPFRT
jgi:hypothetical protein